MNLRFFYLSLVGCACIGLTPQAFAQAGNNNPGGVTAEYNGSITTAGYYDPYTGNAKREIDDIVVPGSIGAYPLKYTRTFNTRGAATWTHNYSWSLWVRPPDEDPGNGDGFYDGPVRGITYPNGGHFDTITYDSPWFIGANGPHGADDKLVTCSSGACTPGSGAAYELWRADGGKVFFSGGRGYAIIDPYGQRTNLTYDASGRLWKVTEPGGRYLQFNYQTYTYLEQNGQWVSVNLLGSVQAYSAPGNLIETVSYGYEPVWITTGYVYVHWYNMTKAYYDDGTQATYAYQASNMNTGGNMGWQTYLNVLHTCDDPRYAGPMKYIKYDYVQWSEAPNFVGQGQIKAEKNVAGQVVSRTSFPTSYSDPNLMRRTETRGDGPSRTFNYAVIGYGVWSTIWTDFKNQPFTTSYPSSLYGWTTTDARGNTTTYELEAALGALRKITYPATSDNGITTREFTFTDPTNPYFHSGEKDENGNWTLFERYSNNQVKKITYPDSSTEEFTYNSFGQVETHKLRSGGTENFRYDTRGRKTEYWPPPTPSDPDPSQHKTQYTYHNTGPHADRLFMEIDPRGNATAYWYNPRGQVVKVQHQDGTYAQSAYNLDGTLAWTADENHPGAATDPNQRTRFEYDEYKRVRKVTNPMGEVTENWYGLDSNWQNPLLHTTNRVKYTLSPMGKNVVYAYDENLRKTHQAVAMGTADEAWTVFEYDEVGNLIKTTDPRGNPTTFGYNARNRQVTVTDALNQTTTTTYDAVGNKLQIMQPDGHTIQYPDHDSMNRLTRQIDQNGVTTTMGYDSAGNLVWQRDGNTQFYSFEYDQLNRRIKMIYPNNDYQQWTYDEAGNRKSRRAVNGYVQSWEYDNRNRPVWMRFYNGPTLIDWIYSQYDAVGRPTWIQNPNAITQRGYDAAGRMTLERQNTYALGDRDVNYAYDLDGHLARLSIPGTDYDRTYGYDEVGRLQFIRNMADNALWFRYWYDASSNEVARYCGLNNTTQSYSRDALNRVWQRAVYSPPVGNVSDEQYGYDSMSRHVSTWRGEDGRLDVFGYDFTGQLTGAQYQLAWNGSAWVSPSRSVSYGLDNNGNRNGVTENGIVSSYTPNSINQYGQAGANAVSNGSEHAVAAYAGLSYSYIADTYLASVSGNGNNYQLYYDGVGRCVKRTLNGVTTYYQYDGERPIYEYKGDGTTAGWNVYGRGIDEILLRTDYVAAPGGQGYFYYQDGLGSVTHLLNFSGLPIESYRYDAFGAPTTTYSTGNFNNRFKFTGREYQAALGIYEYRHRAYHPGLGRFMSEDPIGLQIEGAKLTPDQKALFGAGAPEAFSSSEMNLYRYCHNDPVNHVDPTGLISLTGWGGGDWKWFNGGVALAQIAAQQAATSHRFAPTLAKDGKTAVPSEQSNRGGIYKYQFKAPDGRRVTGPGYTVLEKITDRQGSFPMKTQTEEMPLPRNGIFTDDVGLDFRPSRSYNGFSQVKQSFEVKHNGQPVEVSTVLGHNVTVEDGNVTPSVWVIRP